MVGWCDIRGLFRSRSKVAIEQLFDQFSALCCHSSFFSANIPVQCQMTLLAALLASSGGDHLATAAQVVFDFLGRRCLSLLRDWHFTTASPLY